MRWWAWLYVLLLFSPTILSHMLHYVYFSEIFNIYIWLCNPNFSNCLFAFDLSGFSVLHQLFATRFPFLDPLGWLGVLPSCSFFVFFFNGGSSLIYYLRSSCSRKSAFYIYAYFRVRFSFVSRLCFISFLQWMLLWKSLRPVWFSLFGVDFFLFPRILFMIT